MEQRHVRNVNQRFYMFSASHMLVLLFYCSSFSHIICSNNTRDLVIFFIWRYLPENFDYYTTFTSFLAEEVLHWPEQMIFWKSKVRWISRVRLPSLSFLLFAESFLRNLASNFYAIFQIDFWKFAGNPLFGLQNFTKNF